LQGKTFDQQNLNNLIKQKRQLSKQKTTMETKQQIKELNKQIDNLLYIEEIVFVVFDNVAHYDKINNGGLVINSKKYVRFLSSSGNIRKNTVLYIEEKYKQPLNDILDNGRNKNISQNAGKFNAYHGLYSSNSLVVDFPENMMIVKDYKIKKIVDVLWVEGSGRNISVEPQTKELELTPFDGCGIISQNFAEKWAKNLDVDYLPAWFILRGSFVKGLVQTFPFHDFMKFVSKDKMVEDIYGNMVDVSKIDLIISESQFKLWSSYSSTKEYLDNCKSNGLDFGVTRIAPQIDKKYTWSNYQFLQVLRLNDNQIIGLCKNTVEYFKNILNNNDHKLLYLLGNTTNMIDNDKWFQNIQDPVIKSLFFTDMIDPYVNSIFLRSLNKTIRESYLGKLLFKGNFSAILADGYAFCEYLFDLPVKGLLKEKQYFSHFWNNQNVNNVVSARSPLTHESELNLLNFISNDKTKFWYKYLTTGIAFPVNGMDSIIMSDSDGDGDLVCTIQNQEFIDGVKGGLPVSYEKKSAPKNILTQDEIYKSEKLGFNSNIGFITNISSFFHSLLYNYFPEEKEFKEIQKRLAYLRKAQGQNIDRVKGQLADVFPTHFTKFQKLDYSLEEIELEQIKFDNSLVAKRRPEFFRWLYSHYARRYNKELDDVNFISKIKFGKSFDDLQNSKTTTEEEQKLIDRYYQHSFFLHNNSVMNRISRYMQSQIQEIKQNLKNNNFDPSIYFDKSITIDQNKMNQMKQLLKEYNSFKRTTKENSYENDEAFDNVGQFADHIQNKALSEISSNIQELATMAVQLVYIDIKSGNKEFVWKPFGEGIILNLIQNYDKDFIECPIADESGDIEYLFSKYKNKKFLLSEIL
jgi:hypothetical protein